MNTPLKKYLLKLRKENKRQSEQINKLQQSAENQLKLIWVSISLAAITMLFSYVVKAGTFSAETDKKLQDLVVLLATTLGTIGAAKLTHTQLDASPKDNYNDEDDEEELDDLFKNEDV